MKPNQPEFTPELEEELKALWLRMSLRFDVIRYSDMPEHTARKIEADIEEERQAVYAKLKLI
jgi:hypothetical protein